MVSFAALISALGQNLPIPVGALAYDKSRPIKPRQFIEVVAVGHAVEVSSGLLAFGGRGGLVAGVVVGGLLVGASVVGGAV